MKRGHIVFVDDLRTVIVQRMPCKIFDRIFFVLAFFCAGLKRCQYAKCGRLFFLKKGKSLLCKIYRYVWILRPKAATETSLLYLILFYNDLFSYIFIFFFCFLLLFLFFRSHFVFYVTLFFFFLFLFLFFLLLLFSFFFLLFVVVVFTLKICLRL